MYGMGIVYLNLNHHRISLRLHPTIVFLNQDMAVRLIKKNETTI